MEEFLLQLSQSTNFECIYVFDEKYRPIRKREISDSTLDINIYQQIIEFISGKTPNKPIYIPDLSQYIQDETQINNSLLNHSSISLYINYINEQGKTYLVCLTSIHSDQISSKDILLLDLLFENRQLKNKVKIEQPFNRQIQYSEDLFQIIFNSVPEPISFHELNTHKTILVNNAFLDYTGYTESEVLNKTGKQLQLWHKEEDRLRYRIELENNGYIQNLFAEFKLKNGEIGTGLVSGKIVSFNGEPHLLLIIRDISKQQKLRLELQNTEEKFRKLFNAIPDPVSINKLDSSMGFTDVNHAFLNLTGIEREQLIGKSGFELDLWADPKQRDEYLEQITKKGFVNNFQANYKYSNGHIEKGLISAKTIQIDNQPHLLVILKSIDSLLNMKEKLKISEQKFRSIFDSSPDAININRLDNSEFVEINRSFSRITGYSKQEIIGKNINELNLWFSKKDAKHYFNELKKHSKVNNFETRIKLKNGDIIHTLISAITIKIGGVPHVVNLTRNIENIKVIQKGLKESEEKFRTIVEKSHASILIIDERQEFLYTNPQAQELFGYTSKELKGMNFEKVLHPDSIQLVKERYKKRREGADVPENYVFKIQRKNGEIRDVEISSSTFQNSDGKITTISQLLDITERLQTYALLKNEQLKAQKYLDIAAFMIISIDKNGVLKMVNKKACEILGYSESELIGSNWFELCIPKSNREKAKQRVIDFLNHPKSNVVSESIIETKDGKEKTINWHSAILYNDDNEAYEILSAGEDVTDKLNSIKIINKSKTVAIIWKYIEGSNIHPIKYVSENIEKLLGYTSNELLSNRIKYIDLIHPDDLGHVLHEVKVQSKSPEHDYYTHDYYRLKNKNGNWIWVEDQTEFITDEKGKITHMSGILIDVTEKKQNLQLIQDNEERYKTIFYSNMDGLVIFDENAKIIEVNDVLCKMYGYQRKELLNRKDHAQISIGSNLDLPYVKTHLKENDTLSTESLDTRKDGSRFHVSSKLRWINYNNKEHILAIIRDISDKKKSELELVKAKEKAEESDQLKSSFLANMSHEIRTPMNSIIGFSNLLEDPDLTNEEKSSFIGRIKNNSEQLLRLINDIIDISKIEANQVNLVYSEVNINAFLQNIFDLFELDAANKKIDLKYECHDMEAVRHFNSDNNRLTQIVSNLINNALKFTPSSGQITFGSYPDFKKKEIVFFVKDSGIGISKSAQKHIFHRFRQAHDLTQTEYGGTGLGLSIVKGLVKSMKGRIWLKSEPMQGSEFFIAFPHSFK